jgi:hypothetical protein
MFQINVLEQDSVEKIDKPDFYQLLSSYVSKNAVPLPTHRVREKKPSQTPNLLDLHLREAIK